MVQELVEGGNAREHRVGVPLFQISVGDDGVHHQSETVNGGGEVERHGVVGELGVDLLVEDVRVTHVASHTKRTENGYAVIPALNDTRDGIFLLLFDDDNLGKTLERGKSLVCHLGGDCHVGGEQYVVHTTHVANPLNNLCVVEEVVTPHVASNLQLELHIHTNHIANIVANGDNLVKQTSGGVSPHFRAGLEEVLAGDVGFLNLVLDTKTVLVVDFTSRHQLCSHVREGLVDGINLRLCDLFHPELDEFAVVAKLRVQTLAVQTGLGGFQPTVGNEVGNRTSIELGVTGFTLYAISKGSAEVSHSAGFHTAHFGAESGVASVVGRGDSGVNEELLAPELVVRVKHIGVREDGRHNLATLFALPQLVILGCVKSVHGYSFLLMVKTR